MKDASSIDNLSKEPKNNMQPGYKLKIRKLNKLINSKKFHGIESKNIKKKLQEEFLDIPLKDIAEDLFEPKSLRPILDAKIPVIDKTTNMIKSNEFEPQYRIVIGGSGFLKKKTLKLRNFPFLTEMLHPRNLWIMW